jgi:hypothetical protein
MEFVCHGGTVPQTAGVSSTWTAAPRAAPTRCRKTGSAPSTISSAEPAQPHRNCAARRRPSGGSLGCIGIRLRFGQRIELQGGRQTAHPAREWQAREASSAAVLAPIHDPSGTRIADTSRKVLAGQLCLAARQRLQELPVQIRQNGIIIGRHQAVGALQGSDARRVLPGAPIVSVPSRSTTRRFIKNTPKWRDTSN